MRLPISKMLKLLGYRILSHILYGEKRIEYKKKYKKLKSNISCYPIFDHSRKNFRLYIDITQQYQYDLKTGIQRVVKNIITNIYNISNLKIEVIPIYFKNENYFIAKNFIRKDKLSNTLKDEYKVKWRKGDILFLPEITNYPLWHPLFPELMRNDICIYALFYDLIPIKFPQYVVQELVESFSNYVLFISSLNGIIADSKSAADDYREWRKSNIPATEKPFLIDWFHLGADFNEAMASTGIPDDSSLLFKAMAVRPSLLEVSTVEPRKGHRQTLNAFEQLWAKGVEVNFVIVGKPGWKMDDFFSRVENHPEFGKRLFWLKGISDEYLNKVYETASGVIMPSEAEGFGLAIIEGAYHGKPLILRDIPVFREIAGEHATYFSGLEVEPLADCIEQWITDFKHGSVISSSGIKPLTWAESTKMLLSKLPINA